MKKKWLIPICILAVIALLCAAVLWFASARSLSFSTGRCLVTDNGSYLIVLGNDPVCMNDRTKSEKLFSKLTNGDEILLLHDGIQETYPGGTGAYAVIKLSEGELSDVPEEVINNLAELNWIISEAG